MPTTSRDPATSGGPSTSTDPSRSALLSAFAAYQTPSPGRSLLQIGTTVLPLLALVAAMYALVGVSAWISLALALPAGAFVVRLFIIQHDCGHGAFFRGRRANEWVGRACSLVTMTPFENWRRQHANHHAVWNNLDRRETGADIYSSCTTSAEYAALPPTRRLLVRLLHHPLVANVMLPPLVFIVIYRLPFDTPRAWRRERQSVLITNAALAVLLGALIWAMGIGPVLLVQLSVITVASIIGVWIFSVQHRFEDALWARQTAWDATSAAILGSSYLRLPRVLQWLSGNIGFHHIHHLVPRVPNYRLEDCHKLFLAMGCQARVVTLRDAFRASRYLLWEEERGHMARLTPPR
ncbi:MAG: fatty acid desaturase [Acetobacteraceae bacterium]